VRILAAELHGLRPASIVPLADPVVADLSRRFLADAISRLTDGEDEEQCRAADAGRLNRLSALTGRPLTEPYAAAETAIALQAHRLHGAK
jgi:hypothetical protein